MKYEELQTKCIFDVCQDAEAIAKYTAGITDRDEYLASLERYPENERDAVRVFAMADYAEDTGNAELTKAVESQCKAILDGYFNE